jgi:hypothetical protein
MGLGLLLEPVLARGDDRELGHCEEPVEQDQEEDQQEL